MSAPFELRPVRRLGRKRTLHLSRVLIEDRQVVVRTRCGIRYADGEFTEAFGVPTCSECLAHEAQETNHNPEKGDLS